MMTDIRPGQLWKQVDRGSERLVKVLDVEEDFVGVQECTESGALIEYRRPYHALRARFDVGRVVAEPKGYNVSGGYVLVKDVT